jgi:GDSL-like Lipase/Acylhydrolase
MKKIYAVFGAACLMVGCKPNVIVTQTPTAGRANFSNYLAIGNSLTAGFTDNSLTVSGQLNSYPERLFEQFQLIPGTGGGAKSYFIQPLLHSDNGYPSAKYILGYTYNACTADSSLGPIPYPNFVADPVDAERYVWPNASYNLGQINNLGVPGIRVADLPVAGYAVNMNKYAARFFNQMGAANTPFDEYVYRINSLHPSFFTLWMGANDVLGYATAGGIGDGTGNAVPAGLNIYNTTDITPTSVFTTCYDSLVRLAIKTGAYGALINIPDVTTLPFFNVIPSNSLVITRQSEADSLNALWAHYPVNKAFALGSNQMMVYDHNNQIRQSIPGELILLDLPQSATTCAGYGASQPVPNQYVLTTEEIQYVRNATTAFNQFIYQEALRYNLAYVDMNKYLSTVYSGIVFNGITYNAQFVTGGAFSLDGIHLTQRGYALVANQIISTIDSTYKSTIPLIDVNKYNGVLFP